MKSIGNSGGVLVPKKWMGKKVNILLLEGEAEEEYLKKKFRFFNFYSPEDFLPEYLLHLFMGNFVYGSTGTKYCWVICLSI